VDDARYGSADVQDNPKCQANTRLGIRSKITEWANDDTTETLLWLVGPAGTGKSTIARTLADFFADNG
jgi:adenylylsulfate kinase-like enzyme